MMCTLTAADLQACVLCALLAGAALRVLVKPGPLAHAPSTQGIILTVPG